MDSTALRHPDAHLFCDSVSPTVSKNKIRIQCPPPPKLSIQDPHGSLLPGRWLRQPLSPWRRMTRGIIFMQIIPTMSAAHHPVTSDEGCFQLVGCGLAALQATTTSRNGTDDS